MVSISFCNCICLLKKERGSIKYRMLYWNKTEFNIVGGTFMALSVAQNMLHTIGSTPLVKLDRLTENLEGNIYLCEVRVFFTRAS